MNQPNTSTMTSTPRTLARPDAPVSLAELNSWLVRALPGHQLAYHHGLLSRDRAPEGGLPENQRRVLARVADAARAAAEDRLVHLVQRRSGPFTFAYLAIKRPSIGAVPASATAAIGTDAKTARAAA